MDTPNSGFELIRKFPIDILAGIVSFVPGEDIGRLKMTGCKSLWSVLTCPNVVKSVNLGKDGIRFQSWPSFMNEFPSLESLRIEGYYRQWWSDLSPTLNQLPSTLQQLFILVKDFYSSCDWSCDCFFESPTTGDTLRIDEHLPHLQVLQIIDSMATNFDWVSHCPPTLKSLDVYHWKRGLALPSSVIRFGSSQGMPTGVPRTLESLRCAWGHHPHSLPALTSLSVNFGSGESVQLEEVVSLPRSLTNLEVHSSNLPCVTWSSLPFNLQSLSFCVSNANSTVIHRIVDPISGEVHRVQSFPLELLPKSLTKLHIDGGFEPPMLVSGSCSSLFPPQLKSFDAPYMRLAPNAAKQLPPSLTHLSTSHFYEQLCEHLPPGLTSLSFLNALLSPKTIQCLPKSLTKLNSHFWSFAPGEEVWFDYTTGDTVLCSSLPEYSIHKDYPSYFACLPPNLTSVELCDFVELQDDFIQNQNFSNLLSLTLSHMDQLSDNCIAFLNCHLTNLDVSRSQKITGKSFKSLPKSLTFLKLGSSSHIFDEDIKNLPRTLQYIEIPCATSLSDACIRDFPRCCKRLKIRNNVQITELCIPDFPLSMESFTVETWKWTYGSFLYKSENFL